MRIETATLYSFTHCQDLTFLSGSAAVRVCFRGSLVCWIAAVAWSVGEVLRLRKSGTGREKKCGDGGRLFGVLVLLCQRGDGESCTNHDAHNDVHDNSSLAHEFLRAVQQEHLAVVWCRLALLDCESCSSFIHQLWP